MEGQPLSLLEAMAAGRPVVATSVGGTPELVQMGETGWLVAQGDTIGLSERILWLLENPEHAREMGQAGRQRAIASFDIHNQTAAIGRLFSRLAENRRLQVRNTLRLGRTYNEVRVS
jgi:glycosyltransferase involved in cell wall biosynthesis